MQCAYFQLYKIVFFNIIGYYLSFQLYKMAFYIIETSFFAFTIYKRGFYIYIKVLISLIINYSITCFLLVSAHRP